MGWVREKTGIDLTGGGQRQAASEAASIQADAGQQAIGALTNALADFIGPGEEAVNLLLGAAQAPQQATADQILNDPFYQALSQEQDRNLLSQQASLGLAGSGGTQDALQQNMLLLGNQFRQQDLQNQLSLQQNRFNQLFGVAGIGQGAASQLGAGTANLLTGIGSVESTVPLTAAQVASQQGSQALQLGGAALSAFGGPAGILGGGAALGGTTGGMFGSIPTGGTSPLANFTTSMMP